MGSHNEVIKPPFDMKKNMEVMEVVLTLGNRQIRLVTKWCPKPSQNNKYTIRAFYEECSTVMGHYNLIEDDVIFTGDHNV